MPQLSAQDVVPSLRVDLDLGAPPAGLGTEVITITPAGTGSPLVMPAFELSIARMLDGQRTVGEVIDNCERLGLPLDLRSLEGLFHQLETHGFLSDARHPGLKQVPGGRAGRQSWSLETRELFREALRSARDGSLRAARTAVDEMLALAPDTLEGLLLRDWIDGQRRSRGGEVPFKVAFRATEILWRKEAGPAMPAVLPATRLPAWRPQRRTLLAGAAGLSILGLVAVLPVSRVVLASARLTPIAESAVLAPRDGVIKTIFVHDGQAVAQGDPLLVWNSADLQVQLAETQARLEAARQPLRDAFGATPQGQALLIDLQHAESEVGRAKAALRTVEDADDGLESLAPLEELEERVSRANQWRDQAREALDARALVASTQAARLTPLVQAVQVLQEQLGQRVTVAPAAGTVRDLELQPGEHVGPQQQLLRIENGSSLEVTATVTPMVAKLAKPGDAMTIDFDGRPRAGTVKRVSEFEITAVVPNADGRLERGPRSVNLEFALRPLWRSF